MSDENIKDLVSRWATLRRFRMGLKQQDQDAHAEIDQLRNTLFGLMDKVGLTTFKTPSGEVVYLQPSAYAKLLAPPEEIMAWLDTNNLSYLAPRKISPMLIKEYVAEALAQDLPLPPANLMDLQPQKEVRIKLNKGATNEAGA